jgi:riboflavin kinase/FMN adenylyltransferase
MRVARTPAELGKTPRAVAIGSFDGVHLGHRAVLEALVAAGPTPTVITFDPHPRDVLGYQVALLSSVERRLELLAEAGVEETLLVEFTPELVELPPEGFVEAYLDAIGTELVVATEAFEFGRRREGNLALIASRGIETRVVPEVPGVSSTAIRTLVAEGDVTGAAALLGRPVEVEGIVVAGDARGGTLGFPTANLRPDPALLVPRYGIYAGGIDAGENRGHRAAVSIGVNPHYGGAERRIEAFLLDFHEDLYGQRLVVELWERLRDERAFDSEQELIEQIGRDVEATRAAQRP